MPRIKFTVFVLCLLSLCFSSAFADEIELRDGTLITGTILAQGTTTQIPTQTQSALFNAPQFWIDTKDGLKKINVSDIRNIRFTSTRADVDSFLTQTQKPANDQS